MYIDNFVDVVKTEEISWLACNIISNKYMHVLKKTVGAMRF